ncbi:MAG TPA: DUF5696 domain-containing protein [Vicinamibacteria bacterium]|nr:DUF5696 domain-containing protein [Vicinamibacteria bacterium]
MKSVLAAAVLGLGSLASTEAQGPARPRAEWGATAVTVTRADGRWALGGQTNRVTLDETTLALDVQAGPAGWAFLPSAPGDLRVRSAGEEFPLRLADAPAIRIEPYDAAFKTGLKLTLGGFRHPKGAELDLTLYLTVALEGEDEELVFDVAAKEGEAVVRQLDWPPALDPRDVEHTVLPHYRGTLLPRDWPKAYHPIRPAGTYEARDTSEIQSNVIECWSMSWWGFQKGPAAAMVIVETPDDAAYRFSHPAGGPTLIGSRWRPSLGRLRHPRAARMVFLPRGNYVDMAKRYRRHAVESGLFVSLHEKMAGTPAVRGLIGTPLHRLGILRNLSPDSSRYDANAPEKNYSLKTFDERARQLRELKASGLERFHVVLTGFPYLGYDRQHPDQFPPPPQAGGWAGMKRLAEAAAELGYVFTLHDQYRDYYRDAPSYDPQFAIHEEDAASPPQAFPGTRFGTWKEGRIPWMRHWDGGHQTFLNSRFMLGHLQKNYRLLRRRGIEPDGIYLDVFGYVPPDEDWNEEHPTTRGDNLRDRAACYRWTRHNLGIVGTEAAVDWTIPYVDISSPLGPARAGIPVPLFNLVYHDAVITPYRTGDLHAFVNGGLPQIGNLEEDMAKNLPWIRSLAALHERVALLEMTNHEFLDAGRRKERTTFADGTAVTVDWDAATFTVSP